MGARLREQVVTVNMLAERTTALLLEPFKPRLIAADGLGVVRVSDFSSASILNQFQAPVGKLSLKFFEFVI